MLISYLGDNLLGIKNISNSDHETVFGTWSRTSTPGEISIKIYNDKAPLILNNVKVTETNLSLGINDNFNYQAIRFNKWDYEDVSEYEENFMTEKLNRWRIKATTKESEKQIKNRVLNSLQFCSMYLQYAINNNMSAKVSYIYPLPLYFASNGIRLDPNEQWDKLSYDEEDAAIATEILGNSLMSIPNINRGTPLLRFMINEMIKILEPVK